MTRLGTRHYIITKAKKLQINTKPQTYNTYMFILKKKNKKKNTALTLIITRLFQYI